MLSLLVATTAFTLPTLQISTRPRVPAVSLQARAGSSNCDAVFCLPAEAPRAATRARMQAPDGDDGPSSFAEYLVPYALAVVAALLATSAFFAFLNGAI